MANEQMIRQKITRLRMADVKDKLMGSWVNRVMGGQANKQTSRSANWQTICWADRQKVRFANRLMNRKQMGRWIQRQITGNTKVGSITVLLASCLTGFDSFANKNKNCRLSYS
jgi:hypothetical protein